MFSRVGHRLTRLMQRLYDIHHTHYRYLALIAAAALMVAAMPLASRPTAAAPTYSNGDCWRGGTRWCLNVWQQDAYLHVYVIDNFSDQRPMWGPALDFAVNNWTTAAGPQVLSRQHAPNETWIFFEDSQSWQDNLTDQLLGITWNCSATRCTSGYDAMIVNYSSIKLNKSLLDQYSIGINNSTQAHEVGHALGLMHSPDTNQLMYYQVSENKVPTNADIGILPPCAGSDDQHGIRCIYNWTR